MCRATSRDAVARRAFNELKTLDERKNHSNQLEQFVKRAGQVRSGDAQYRHSLGKPFSVPHTPVVKTHPYEELLVQSVYMPLQLAPNSLTQPILPNWSFHLFNVNLGASSNAAVEREALEKVGSYGKQIGHLAETLELLVKKLKLLESKELSQEERDILQVFLGDVSAVRQIKSSLPKP